MEDVGLVLIPVHPAPQRPLRSRPSDHPGVVTRRDGVEIEGGRPLQKAIELQVPVALDTGVRRASRGVVGHIGTYDVALEGLAEVEHVMGYAQLLSHPAGVVNVRDRAAAGVGGTAPELHGHSHHVVALAC